MQPFNQLIWDVVYSIDWPPHPFWQFIPSVFVPAHYAFGKASSLSGISNASLTFLIMGRTIASS
jgi:hypothetical protein